MPIGHIPLGDKVRSLREAKGWTQQDLAKEAGVDEKTVSKIENCKPVMLRLISYVAQALKVECGEVLPPPVTDATPSTNSNERRYLMILTFNVKIEDIERAIQFIDDFKSEIPIRHPCLTLDMDAGSLIVQMEFAYDDVIQLIYQFCRSVTDQFNLKTLLLYNFNSDELLIAEVAIRLRTLSDDIARTHIVPLSNQRQAQWIKLLESYGQDAISSPSDGLLTRLTDQADFADIIRWLRGSRGRQILETDVWLDWLEARKNVQFPNLQVKLEGSVVVLVPDPEGSSPQPQLSNR